MLESSSDLIRTARNLANNTEDAHTWQQMAGHSKVQSDVIKKLVASIRDNARGQKECNEAVSQINESIKELNNASISTCQQNLQVHDGNDLEKFQSKV